MILPILISAAYSPSLLIDDTREMLKGISKDDLKNIKIFFDSGAFTFASNKKTYSVKDYCKYIDEVKEFFSPYGIEVEYVCLDVIGDQLKTHRNFKEMLDLGYNPMPVFTTNAQNSMLNAYLKKYNRVAIGGLVGNPQNFDYINHLYKYTNIKKYSSEKVHWFGYTNIQQMMAYKPHSVDSTGLTTESQRYKVIHIIDDKGIFHVVNKQDLISKNKLFYITNNFCERYGLDFQRLLEDDEWVTPRYFSFVNLVSSILYINRVHRKLGTIWYLASSGKQILLQVIECYKYILDFKKEEEKKNA
jgi:hypothetical protein